MKYHVAFTITLMLAGCGVPDPGTAPQGDVARVQDKRIARLELEPGHVVEFYELAPGRIAMLEQGSLDTKDAPLDREALAGLSMAAIHELLAPGTPVPEVLRQAEQRRIADEDASVPASLQAPGLHEIEETLSPVAQTEGLSAAVKGRPSTEALAKGASSNAINALDAASDVAWWQAAFCSGSQVDEVWCPTDVIWAHSGWRGTMYYEAAGMSASSIAGATFWVDQFTSDWTRVLTVNVGPRGWWRWWWNGEGTFRSGVDGLAPEPWVHFSERIRHAITGFTHYNYYPNEAEWQFNNDIQGATHDADSWYFTRTIYPAIGKKKGVVAKAAVGYNLNNQPSIRYEEPSAMLDAGYNHFGDLAHRAGLLYIAIDGSAGAGVAVWSTDIRFYVGWASLPGLSGCPWIAYNPRDGLFYVPEGSRVLRRYSIDVNGTTVTPVEVLPRITLSMDITSQQGGDFSSRGILYIARGHYANPMAVYGVDIYNGMVYQRVVYNGSPASDWEGEGVTVWDLSAGQAPGIRGHLHFQLLDNDTDNDDFSFAHLTAIDPARM